MYLLHIEVTFQVNTISNKLHDHYIKYFQDKRVEYVETGV